MTEAPFSSFSLTFQTAGKSNVTVIADDIITQLAANKCLTVGELNSFTSHNPLQTADITYSLWSNKSFIYALSQATEVETIAASWGFHIDFSISSTTGKLTIASSNGTSIYIVVNNDSTEKILGHLQSLNATSTTSREGTYKMQYIIVPTNLYYSKDSGLYETENSASLAIPASGAEPYGMSRGMIHYRHDWSHVGEPKANVIDSETATGFRFMFAWLKRGYPFMLYGGVGNNPVGYLVPESEFKPKRMFDDDDTLWEVKLETIELGYVTYT